MARLFFLIKRYHFILLWLFSPYFNVSLSAEASIANQTHLSDQVVIKKIAKKYGDKFLEYLKKMADHESYSPTYAPKSQEQIKFEANIYGAMFGWHLEKMIRRFIMTASNNNSFIQKKMKEFFTSLTQTGLTTITDELKNLNQTMINEHGKIIDDYVKGILPKIKSATQQVDNAVGFNMHRTLKIAIGVTVICSAVYGTRVFWNWFENYFYQPKIISEYYNAGMISALKERFIEPKIIPDIILHDEVKRQIERLVKRTKNCIQGVNEGKKNTYFGNLLLYGKPGTGKTHFARRLAIESGVSYAIISAPAFFQPGAGIKAIDSLFSWAQRSRTPVIIVLDEADALFSSRDNMRIDSEEYKIISHLLHYLGQRNNRFMIIMTTNHHYAFDEAMQRRIDEAIEMPLPDKKMRKDILHLYATKILFNSKDNGDLFVKNAQKVFSDQKMTHIATRTEGLSNGDLAGIINTIYNECFTSQSGNITENMINTIVDGYIKKCTMFQLHQQKK